MRKKDLLLGFYVLEASEVKLALVPTYDSGCLWRALINMLDFCKQ